MKGYLKLNVDVGYKDSLATLAILAKDEVGRVQELWFEKVSFNSILEAEVKAIFDACAIAKDKPYINIIIESDYKLIVDAILGFSSCL